MLKFFRKIRRSLILGNKTSKYLLYAAGEIFLIIMGVLIALSVAEWNNSRKDKSYEKKVLLGIQEDLENVLERLDQTISFNENRIKKLSTLDSLLKQENVEYHESLDTLFAAVWLFAKFGIERAQYESLKSKGLDLIKDDVLRKELILVYEEIYDSFEDLNKIEDDINNIAYFEYHMTNFHALNWAVSMKPNDFSSLWRDNYYKNLVYARLISLQGNQMNSYNFARIQIDKLKETIKKYIDH